MRSVAHVKQENEKIGSIAVAVRANGIKHCDNFTDYVNFISSLNHENPHIAFINKKLAAAEEWLKTPSANDAFEEMYHCQVNIIHHFFLTSYIKLILSLKNIGSGAPGPMYLVVFTQMSALLRAWAKS
jgi:ABC-type transport system involved in cytochrome bd biosynthesis fused ATPase/permease subunit